MFRWFTPELLSELNRRCDEAKCRAGGGRGGGDPDLFVFTDAGDRFFVEVKDQDELITTQRATFPVIAEILRCDVLTARIVKQPGANQATGCGWCRGPLTSWHCSHARLRRSSRIRGAAPVRASPRIHAVLLIIADPQLADRTSPRRISGAPCAGGSCPRARYISPNGGAGTNPS